MTDIAQSQGPRGATTLLTSLVVIALFFSGFLNLIPSPGFAPATLLIDGALVLMTAILTVRVFVRGASSPVASWVILWVTLIVVYAALMLHGSESFGIKLTTVRSHALYIVIAVFVASCFKTRGEIMRVLNLIMTLGAGFAAFGILQYLLRNVLPEWLLYSNDTELFGYFGTDITRSTGLMGNTIVYSAAMLLVFALWAFRFAENPRLSTAIVSGLVLLSIFFTFSRVAIAGALLIAFAVMMRLVVRAGRSRAIVLMCGLLLLVGIGSLSVWTSPRALSYLRESFIWKGLFLGQNASVQGSTSGHDGFLQFAAQSFERNPFVGLGIASQNAGSKFSETHRVLTDGAHLAILVEGGLLLFVPWILLLGSVVYAILRACHGLGGEDHFVVFGLLAFAIYQLGFASFLNSAFFGKAPFLLFWTVFGLIVALERVNRVERLQLGPERGQSTRRVLS